MKLCMSSIFDGEVKEKILCCMKDLKFFYKEMVGDDLKEECEEEEQLENAENQDKELASQ